ncbi:major histocompatibility complex class I-related gene protein-like isoform X3 [Ictalurus furcatus]|uniref:major histocompatibility complex class I-related gene protein-like isoform X3 n=1 Tax=Ictalurus furcatus TaxID=66913 RepID=UPI0023501008|nr:major histocompatibility complex class I-related gene protein-like isoform X3 [Ictalurus furcatus]
MGWTSLIFSASVLLCAAVPVLSGQHSLYYTYTALSKSIKLPGIYEFTALGMLDDRELDYYTSETQAKVPKQHWMSEKMPQDYWEKGTQSRKSKEQWFKVNVDILMERMGHNKTELHVLQWRHGCEIETTGGNIKFVSGVDEYSYDGTEFLSFDDVNSRWIAPVPAAEPTKRKWDDVPILNQYTKGYLEKECVDWLKKFMDYGKEELRKHSPPDVHLFAKKSVTDPSKLTLTCLATGFYPPDIEMRLRKLRTSLPEHLVTSSGVRPNGDGSYQLRKSVDIVEDDKALYGCYVNHETLPEPIIIPDGKGIQCPDCTAPSTQSGIIGGVVGVLLTVAVVAGIIFFLIRNGQIRLRCNSGSPANSTVHVPLAAPAPSPATVSATVSATHLPVNKGPYINGAKASDSAIDSGNDSASGSSDGSQGNIGSPAHSQMQSDENTPMLP